MNHQSTYQALDDMTDDELLIFVDRSDPQVRILAERLADMAVTVRRQNEVLAQTDVDLQELQNILAERGPL